MFDKIKMARWLNIPKMKADAKQHARNVGTRWDILQGQRKPGQDPNDPELYIEVKPGVWKIWPHDLRDMRSRYYKTAPDAEGRQGRTAGRVLGDDLKEGSFSAAIPVLFALVPVLSMVIAVLHAIPMVWLIPVAALFATLIFIATATESIGWALGSAVVAMLPLISVGLVSMGVVGQMAGDKAPDFGSAATWIPLVALGGLAFLFGGLRRARIAVGGLLGIGLIVLACTHLPEPLRPLFLSLPACGLPMLWAFVQKDTRTFHEAWQGQQFSWEDSPNGTYHIESRREQTLRAAAQEQA